MKVAIRYYTMTGHTKLLADAISEVVGVPAKPLSDGLDEDVDLLFLGSSIYGNSIDPAVNRFFNNLNVDVGLIVNFSTAGVMDSTFSQVKDIADLFGIEISDDEFHCRGAFAGLNASRPDESDVEDVKLFARKFIE